MTECCPIISMSTSPGFTRRRLGCVGKPLESVTVTIRHPDTQVSVYFMDIECLHYLTLNLEPFI
jgi:long-subunit acyl-CoA synthetase (AMP-forming)